MKSKQYTLSEIANHVQLPVHGDDTVIVTTLAPLQSAESGSISFLDNPVYRKYLTNTKASAVIISPAMKELCPVSAIISDNPYVTYAHVAQLFNNRKIAAPGIHSSSVIAPSAHIDSTVSIGPNVVVGENVRIDAHVTIGANSVIGDDCEIGSQTRIYPNVSIYENTKIGARCTIHSGVVLGADGFGIANNKGVWVPVPQLGGLVIGNDVDIGANTTIDRGAIADTCIGNGVKLDNQIQIGHNVIIGDHTAIAGCAGIAGSSKIGKHCIIGGGAGVSGHVELADQVHLAAMSNVRNSITEPGIYSNNLSAIEFKQWLKIESRLKQLNEIVQRIKKLEKQAESV